MESENQKNSIYKSAANYGFILGLAVIVYSILMRLAGFLESGFTSFGYQALMAAGIAFGIKKYTEEIVEGFISYSQAFRLGLMISIFSGLIQAFFVYIYYHYISQEELTIMVNSMQELLIKMGKSDEEVEIASSIISPAYIGFVILLKEFLKGLVFSLIISAFLKKEKGIFED